MKKIISAYLILFSIVFLSGCGTSKGGGFNLFSVEQDKQLGAQVAQEIESNPTEYPILDSARYATAYRFLYDIRDRILNSQAIDFKDEFAWRLRIIEDDKTLNAFCTPGGYIYVYTGLIKFLDGEDELAGVLAHEIGHADLRHSTRQMTKVYGVQVLLDLIAGDRELLKDITTSLINLKFSRTHETEADGASVKYLCETEYAASSAAKFFEKVEASGAASPPEWLSTHPSHDKRIENFYTTAGGMSCSGNNAAKERYQQLKNALP
ncbi:MAG: M48 family metalloprotease [Brumimicrobium sp.]